MSDDLVTVAARLTILRDGDRTADIDIIRTLVAEGYIAILPRQPTLSVVAAIVTTTEKATAYAATVIAEINRLTGRKFKVGDDVVRQCRQIIKAKITVEAALAAIRFKHSEWSSKPDMAQYVQPSTLLRLSNMKKYIDQMEAGPARANGIGGTASTGFAPWGDS